MFPKENDDLDDIDENHADVFCGHSVVDKDDDGHDGHDDDVS